MSGIRIAQSTNGSGNEPMTSVGAHVTSEDMALGGRRHAKPFSGRTSGAVYARPRASAFQLRRLIISSRTRAISASSGIARTGNRCASRTIRPRRWPSFTVASTNRRDAAKRGSLWTEIAPGTRTGGRGRPREFSFGDRSGAFPLLNVHKSRRRRLRFF